MYDFVMFGLQQINIQNNTNTPDARGLNPEMAKKFDCNLSGMNSSASYCHMEYEWYLCEDL